MNQRDANYYKLVKNIGEMIAAMLSILQTCEEIFIQMEEADKRQ